MNKLAINKLEEIKKSKSANEKDEIIIDLLLAATNDWPTPILDLESYEVEVERFIGNKTTKENIENKLSKIDFSKDAWRAESLSQLIELFAFFPKSTSLRAIIAEMNSMFNSRV